MLRLIIGCLLMHVNVRLFLKVGQKLCFRQGTDLNTTYLEEKYCICNSDLLRQYKGSDCGIPVSVWKNHGRVIKIITQGQNKTLVLFRFHKVQIAKTAKKSYIGRPLQSRVRLVGSQVRPIGRCGRPFHDPGVELDSGGRS